MKKTIIVLARALRNVSKDQFFHAACVSLFPGTHNHCH